MEKTYFVDDDLFNVLHDFGWVKSEEEVLKEKKQKEEAAKQKEQEKQEKPEEPEEPEDHYFTCPYDNIQEEFDCVNEKLDVVLKCLKTILTVLRDNG